MFAGIALDDAVRAACEDVLDALRRTGFAAKFEEGNKLHVTLAFLGNVEDTRYGDVVAAMNAAAAHCAPFAATLDKVGAFPHERKPRIIYVGAREQGASFRALSAKLRSEFTQLGFSFNDDAVAHVTIARVKDPHRPLPLIDIAPVRLPVTALTLFESIFDKEKNTSRYVASATSDLSASAANEA
ncbi:MAG: RNA 2',3'-cyclic phosphodiesterase [Candidatus Eremiobacteraeota bacterium]|nr:RNA 2',3'-cyclic phosphodiesterase [Candidatus Eremiobacteraeota bacterium]